MPTATVHTPVLLDDIIFFLEGNRTSDRFHVFDGTLGGGGYTKRFLELGCEVWSCDLDQSAINIALYSYKENVDNKTLHLAQDNFVTSIETFDNSFFDFITLDLGYSSDQLELSGRGFSYLKTTELWDLRFDNQTGIPAWMVVNQQTVDKLWKIIYSNSGEKYARPIARALKLFVQENPSKPLNVEETAKIIEMALPIPVRRKNLMGTLSRVWQAFRIEVNNEFESLEKFLRSAVKKVKVGGKIAIVSFHSLEDKRVTQYFREISKPQQIDDYGNKNYMYRLLTKHAVKPSDEEIINNVRSRSGLLRVIERLN